jgi:phosphoribosyl 1,2-cyclic phosphodiesterase
MLTSDFSFVPEKARENLKNGLKQSHATLEDLAKMAAKSKVKKVVLTHIGLGNVDVNSIICSLFSIEKAFVQCKQL